MTKGNDVVLVSLFVTLNLFQPYSRVSAFGFEQVNVNVCGKSVLCLFTCLRAKQRHRSTSVIVNWFYLTCSYLVVVFLLSIFRMKLFAEFDILYFFVFRLK